MASFYAINKFIDDSGIPTIMVESGIIAQVSMNDLFQKNTLIEINDCIL